MTPLDYVVLVIYFLAMAVIGLWAMRRIKAQEDFFMGGRTFGKLLQTFASFGAGTGSSDPVNTARTTFTSGMSGMWSIMSWLFVTPFYWITGVWYRRMRLLTLGDWFVERYESPALGGAYAVFGLVFYMVYTAMLFTATVKFAAPLMGDTITLGDSPVALEYALVPAIAVIVVLYGLAGGLTAAYWTDLVQGVFIIVLSVLLIPFGLNALVAKYGDPSSQGTLDGMRIMHEQLPPEMFQIIGSTRSSDFPLSMIAVVSLMLVVGAVVMPHFIATGGGSAKSEFDARMGIVIGNLLKRFCTIGWALTALIILALMADDALLRDDPDKVWGVATLKLLGPGLRGLMLACLLAALMGSADTYMLVCAALVVRNIYVPIAGNDASERRLILVGRISGALVIAGAVFFSWWLMNVFQQLQLTWIVPMLFAAPFWVGMYWRRATVAAAWATVAVAALQFFIVPVLVPLLMPDLRMNPSFSETNHIVKITTARTAAPSDVARRASAISEWDDLRQLIINRTSDAQRDKLLAELGPRPEPLQLGDQVTELRSGGGKAIYWTGGAQPVDADGTVLTDVPLQPLGQSEKIDEHSTQEVMRYAPDVTLVGQGNFKLDFLLYDMIGMDLASKSDATLKMLEFPPKKAMPFVVMILVSLVTRPARKENLDRYYAKMKTPVAKDRDEDRRALQAAYDDPEALENRKLFPGSSIEIQRPGPEDVLGFVLCFAACFGIVFLAVLIARLGR